MLRVRPVPKSRVSAPGGLTLSLVTSDPGWQRPEDSAARPATARLVDPEEDLGGAGYGGDFETTRIPPMGAPPAPGPSTGYGLVSGPEPLPYVQPEPIPMPPPPSFEKRPVEIAASDAEVKAAGRRGTQDLGLLLIRLTLGVVLIAHGLQRAFGWWGGSGLEGLKDTIAEAGYQHAGVLTYITAGALIGAGVFLVLGLFTPLAGAVALGFLVNSLLVMFESQRKAGGVFIFGSDGAEYLLTLTALAAAIILAGPGRYGFDGGRGWARRPFIGSLLALVLGIGGGVAAWMFLHGTNPFAR